ncbi:phage antirepressor KilAC domain-containing protein [Escherichia coli]
MGRRHCKEYLYTLKQAAILLGYHEHEFIELLVAREVLYQVCLTLYPKKKYLEEKMFTIMTDENQVNHAFVTDKGINYLRDNL